MPAGWHGAAEEVATCAAGCAAVSIPCCICASCAAADATAAPAAGERSMGRVSPCTSPTPIAACGEIMCSSAEGGRPDAAAATAACVACSRSSACSCACCAEAVMAAPPATGPATGAARSLKRGTLRAGGSTEAAPSLPAGALRLRLGVASAGLRGSRKWNAASPTSSRSRDLRGRVPEAPPSSGATALPFTRTPFLPSTRSLKHLQNAMHSTRAV